MDGETGEEHKLLNAMQMTHKGLENRIESSARLFPGGMQPFMLLARFRLFKNRAMTPERQALIKQFLDFAD